MFQIYFHNFWREYCLGLCETEKDGTRRLGKEYPQLTFVEDNESYDYFTVHQATWENEEVKYSARTVKECEEYCEKYLEKYAQFKQDIKLGILGQRFGQEVENLWED